MDAKASQKEMNDFVNFFKSIGGSIETKNSQRNKEIKQELVKNKKACADLLNRTYGDAFDIKK